LDISTHCHLPTLTTVSWLMRLLRWGSGILVAPNCKLTSKPTHVIIKPRLLIAEYCGVEARQERKKKAPREVEHKCIVFSVWWSFQRSFIHLLQTLSK
jgi:hypothetical protein